MARIRGSNTSPELVIRRELWARGFRYRVNFRTPVARADIVFAAHRVAVFIDGCYWHGCPKHYVRPRSRTDFWSAKLLQNVRRDISQTKMLEDLGWRVVRVWEHDVFEAPNAVIREIETRIATGRIRSRRCWRVFEVNPLNDGSDSEMRHMCDLRDPSRTRSARRRRSTKKWTHRA